MSDTLTITGKDIDGVGELENGSDYTAAEDEARSGRVVSSDWLPEVRLQLDAIKRLPHGWDSHDSPPPDTRVIEAGWGLLLCLCEGGELPRPHVNPTPSGGVQFEWEAGDRYFELEVVAERAAEYFYCDRDRGVEKEGVVFESESLEPVVRHIREIAAAQ